MGEIDDTKKRITVRLWKDATPKHAIAILAHEYAHLKKGTTTIEIGLSEGQVWERGATYAQAWGVLPEYLKLAKELTDSYDKRKIYPEVTRQIREWLKQRGG